MFFRESSICVNSEEEVFSFKEEWYHFFQKYCLPSVLSQTLPVKWIFVVDQEAQKDYAKIKKMTKGLDIEFVLKKDIHDYLSSFAPETIETFRLDADDVMSKDLLRQVDRVLRKRFIGVDAVLSGPSIGFVGIEGKNSCHQFNCPGIAIGLGVISNKAGGHCYYPHRSEISILKKKGISCKKVLTNRGRYIYIRHNKSWSRAAHGVSKERRYEKGLYVGTLGEKVKELIS